MSGVEIKKILDQYSVFEKPYHIKQLSSKGVWVINGQFVLKRLKNMDVATNICLILDSLNADGFCVGNYVCTSDGLTFFHDIDKDYIVKEYISGKPLEIKDVLKMREAWGRILGCSLARLHTSFASIREKFNEANTMLEYDESVKLLHDKKIVIPKNIVTDCETFKMIYKYLPRQLIHRDVQLRNIIFNDNCDVYFVDFDSCENNVRIYDLAYFGITLLNSISNKFNLKLWREIYQFFIQGYMKTNKLEQIEMDSIWRMLIILQICFMRYYIEIKESIYIDFFFKNLLYVYDNRFDLVKFK